MFSDPTLFVIGAGASFELGLPTGLELKGRVENLLNITYPDGRNQKTGDYQIAELLRRRARDAGNTSWNSLLYKCWQIRDALPGALSIDNVLDAHHLDDELAFCGKLAIVKAILEGERSSKLFKADPNEKTTVFQRAAGTWLIPFFQLLTEGVRKEDVDGLFKNVSIITYNYDRSIERFLPEAVALYYGLEDREASELVSTLRITHPYGSVGSFQPTSSCCAAYGDEHANLALLAERIRTFTEGLEDLELKGSIDQSYVGAKQIVFLGFAFHPINLQLLQADAVTSAKKIFATTYGFSKAAQTVAKDMVLQSLNKLETATGNIQQRHKDKYVDSLNFESITARELLDSHFRSIGSSGKKQEV